MRMLYDTTTVRPWERYDYYRAKAAAEAAPVAVLGRSPGSMLAKMSVAQFGDFEIAATSWAADAEIVARRTERMIRTGDPEGYRICVCISGSVRAEQAGNRVPLGPGDIGLYDMSRPWQTTHTSGRIPTRVVQLTVPHSLLPIAPATIRPLLGAAVPRILPGRVAISEFLISLAGTADEPADQGLDDALRECATGLLHQWLGLPDGITPQTHRLLREAYVRRIIRQRHGDPNLDVGGIARAAQMSPRYLHKLFQGAELTPIQLLKRVRLEACHRSLRDPALMSRPVKDVIAAHGYLRADQFARDFKQLFGVSATQVRESAREQLAEQRR